jgi:hypothetical protein
MCEHRGSRVFDSVKQCRPIGVRSRTALNSTVCTLDPRGAFLSSIRPVECRTRGFLLYVHVNSPSAECQVSTTAQLSDEPASCSRSRNGHKQITTCASCGHTANLDYDDGLVLFAIARQDYVIGSGSWKGYHQTQDERLGVCPNFF